MLPILLLAHFLADYPLQTDWIVRNKQRIEVLLLHIGIHLVTMLALFLPLLRQLWPFLLALAGIHLVIDIWKNWVNRRWPQWVVWPYIVDQIFHWISIGLTSLWISRALPGLEPPFGPQLAVVLLGYLAVTYVWFISERILAHATPDYRREVNSQLWHRMAARAGWLSVFLLVFGAIANGIGAALLIPLPYTEGKFRYRALYTDIVVALVVAVLMQIGLRLLGRN